MNVLFKIAGIFIFTTASLAFAAPELIREKRSSRGGSEISSEICTWKDGEISLSRTYQSHFGPLIFTERRELPIDESSQGALVQLAEQAFSGAIRNGDDAADPKLDLSYFVRNDSSAPKLLIKFGWDGRVVKFNNAQSSEALTRMIENLCNTQWQMMSTAWPVDH